MHFSFKHIIMNVAQTKHRDVFLSGARSVSVCVRARVGMSLCICML